MNQYFSKNSHSFPLEFDYQATTPCDEEVLDAMKPYWNNCFGNPSSRQHRNGLKASAAVGVAREKLSELIGILPENLIFTSGATEANNLAILGHARARAFEIGKPGHLITSLTEHRSVLDPMRQLKNEGFHLTELCPNDEGLITQSQLEDAINSETILVSIMTGNNEIGVLQPIANLAESCKSHDIIFHTDAVQSFGHIPLHENYLGADLVSLSAHKLYGPKGIGALVMNSNVSILPLQWGGGQENGLRPGTLPVPLIVGFAKAVEIAMRDIKTQSNKIKLLRDYLWDKLLINIPGLIVNGSLDERLPNNLNFTVPNVKGVALFEKLKPLLSCSSGSACSMGEASHVLLALGRDSNQAKASIRLSLSKFTTGEDVDQVIKILIEIINSF